MPKYKLSDILKRLMFDRSIKTMELARVTHLPQPTVQRIVTGTTANPHISSLLPIADFFGVSVEQLKGNEPIPQLESPQVLPTGMIQIPISTWQDVIYGPKTLNDTNITAHKTLWVEDKINAAAFALVLPDASMFPVFPKGSLIIIDPDKAAKDRSYVLVALKDHSEALFRQLLIDANKQYLKPLSPDLEHFPMIPLSQEDKICGVLVQARKDFEE